MRAGLKSTAATQGPTTRRTLVTVRSTLVSGNASFPRKSVLVVNFAVVISIGILRVRRPAGELAEVDGGAPSRGIGQPAITGEHRAAEGSEGGPAASTPARGSGNHRSAE